MKYIKVTWSHDLPGEPVIMYSEIDQDRWETRKVEVFSDNNLFYASGDSASGPTRLGIVPVPPADEISSDPQFLYEEIGAVEFDEIWRRAHNA